MKVRFYRWYNTLLTTLLGMLGYGCSSDEPMDMYGPPIMCEYGVPQAEYNIKGSVVDEQGVPVEGIKTSLKYVSEERDANGKCLAMGIDSLQTDAAGRFNFVYEDFPKNQHIKLLVEDIDGEANGCTFQNDTIDIDYNKAVQTKDGDGNWNEGTFEIKQDIQLKKK